MRLTQLHFEARVLFKLTKQLGNASGYSFDGLKYLLRTQFSARIEFYGYFWAMVTLILLNVSWVTLGILTILFFILIAVEALNTAIEVIMDRISPEISDTAKHAKDLGSFAVFCMITVNTVFFIVSILQSRPVQSLLS